MAVGGVGLWFCVVPERKGGDMEKYEVIKDIGSGNFGVARLMRNKETKEFVAMKYIERGRKVLLLTSLLLCLIFAFYGVEFRNHS